MKISLAAEAQQKLIEARCNARVKLDTNSVKRLSKTSRHLRDGAGLEEAPGESAKETIATLELAKPAKCSANP